MITRNEGFDIYLCCYWTYFVL